QLYQAVCEIPLWDLHMLWHYSKLLKATMMKVWTKLYKPLFRLFREHIWFAYCTRMKKENSEAGLHLRKVFKQPMTTTAEIDEVSVQGDIDNRFRKRKRKKLDLDGDDSSIDKLEDEID